MVKVAIKNDCAEYLEWYFDEVNNISSDKTTADDEGDNKSNGNLWSVYWLVLIVFVAVSVSLID